MKIDVREDTIGTGDAFCPTCLHLYFEEEEGCKFCAATNQAISALNVRELGPVPSQLELPARVDSGSGDWWLAIRSGAKFYGTPEDAAWEREPLGEFPQDTLVKWGESQQVSRRGYTAKISRPDPDHQYGWVWASPEAGVFKRKNKDDAWRALTGPFREH